MTEGTGASAIEDKLEMIVSSLCSFWFILLSTLLGHIAV